MDKTLPFNELLPTLKKLNAGPRSHRIFENLTEAQVINIFGAAHADKIHLLDEVPVYRHLDIPSGELWLKDRNDKIIAKFTA